MSWEFVNSGEPRSRKTYRCDCCGTQIPKGVKYYNLSGKFEGEMSTVRCHIECEKKFQELTRYPGSQYDEFSYSNFYEYFGNEEACNAHKQMILSIYQPDRVMK